MEKEVKESRWERLNKIITDKKNSEHDWRMEHCDMHGNFYYYRCYKCDLGAGFGELEDAEKIPCNSTRRNLVDGPTNTKFCYNPKDKFSFYPTE